MLLAASRMVLRRQAWISRRALFRNASTTSEAANAASSGATKAKDSASEAASKASAGLSRVTSSAGPALRNATEAAGNAVNSVGGRTGNAIGFVTSLIGPTTYWARVGGELAKLVFEGQRMQPPNVATFQSYYQPLINRLRNPSTIFAQTANQAGSMSPQSVLQQIRNIDTKTVVTLGVISAEVLGFFKVGEILGRFKLVGYRSNGGHGEHH
ncbi:putative mitochondrial F1F0-ATP synthase g subunit [Viridothelium virens]|uniref:Putative mitochondrial F1F0-ATP synthase g subunit n=1 Tax=Viridothelium virens TaxID=1048519 RepID=A0A6A6H127_VIRVR|nr:putative mitochondrial F1F0-ATP synthase g subunit [Viridothelium virens]